MAVMALGACAAQPQLAAARGDIPIEGKNVHPESITSSADGSVFIAKFTATGSCIWARTHDVGLHLRGIVRLPDGHFVLSMTGGKPLDDENGLRNWGVLMKDTPNVPPWPQVLDEMQQAGYTGTELGPYGYLPLDVNRLRDQLGKRGLTLCSAFTIVNLVDPQARAQEYEEALTTARFLSQMGCAWIVLSDALFVNPIRSYWWLLFWPSGFLGATLLSLNFIGDGLRDALDPKARS